MPESIYGNIDAEIKYTDLTDNSIIIQNSGPRGGGGDSLTPLELDLDLEYSGLV